jgi:16S rRNA pseudouridine516 synthase
MRNRKDTLAALLMEQGFGTRKECARLVWAKEVETGHAAGNGPEAEIAWMQAEEPDEEVTREGLHLRVQGLTVPYLENIHLAFHKPVNTECSHSPSHHQSIFAFFPQPFLRRGLEAVGRLDADTTGLLLLSDSGPFIHHFTSPKRHVAKTYRVGTKHPIAPEQIAKLSAGVELRSEDGITLPAKVALLEEKLCDMTLEEGKYHQVKRMFAAVGNRVETIHRIAVGSLELGDSLAPGKWRLLTGAELNSLGFTGA